MDTETPQKMKITLKQTLNPEDALLAAKRLQEMMRRFDPNAVVTFVETEEDGVKLFSKRFGDEGVI